MPEARQAFYGTRRIFDDRSTALKGLLWQQGVEYGIRVRCYVEGATELGALRHVFDPYGRIDIVNLHGRVVERGGKGIALRETLRANTREQVFSFILLDGDRSDFVSAVQTAAKDDDFVGAFFVANPDFELANFTKEELFDVACSLRGVVVSAKERTKYLSDLASRDSADDFLRAFQSIDDKLIGVSKSETWGEALMSKALTHQKLGAEERLVIRAARLITHALQVNFVEQRDKFRIDPASGLPVRR
jgi:hypothetical protein